jgi:hypothetical protein
MDIDLWVDSAGCEMSFTTSCDCICGLLGIYNSGQAGLPQVFEFVVQDLHNVVGLIR